MTENVYSSIDEMIELSERKIELLRELKRALLMADLIGRKPGELSWPLIVRWREGSSSFFPWTGAQMYVREDHPDGPIEHVFDMLDEVHRSLWPEHLRKGYELYEARKAKQRAIAEERRASRN